MNPLIYFRWYRRWRGGVWGHHSGLLFRKTWTRLDYMPLDFSERLGDEDWRTEATELPKSRPQPQTWDAVIAERVLREALAHAEKRDRPL